MWPGIEVSNRTVWQQYRITFCTWFQSLYVVSEVKMSRQTTFGRFGFKKSIPHRGTLTEMKIPDFVSTASKTVKCSHYASLCESTRVISAWECVHGVQSSRMTKGTGPKEHSSTENESEIKITVWVFLIKSYHLLQGKAVIQKKV